MNIYDNISFSWNGDPTIRLKTLTELAYLTDVARASSGKKTFNGVGPVLDVSLFYGTPTRVATVKLPAFKYDNADKKLIETGKNIVSPIVMSILEERATANVTDFDLEGYKTTKLREAEGNKVTIENSFTSYCASVDASLTLSAEDKKKRKQEAGKNYRVQLYLAKKEITRLKRLDKRNIESILNSEIVAVETQISAFENMSIDPSVDPKQAECMNYLDNIYKLIQLKKQIAKYQTGSKKVPQKLVKGLAFTVAGVMAVTGALHLGKNISRHGGAADKQQVVVKNTPAPTVRPPIYDTTTTNSKYSMQELIDTLQRSGYNGYDQNQLRGLDFLLNPAKYAGLTDSEYFALVCAADQIVVSLASNEDFTFLSGAAINEYKNGSQDNIIENPDQYSLFDVVFTIRKKILDIISGKAKGDIAEYELRLTIILSQYLGKNGKILAELLRTGDISVDDFRYAVESGKFVVPTDEKIYIFSRAA